MEHYRLAILWAKWNGMQGTEKQVEKIMKQLSYYQLEWDKYGLAWSMGINRPCNKVPN